MRDTTCSVPDVVSRGFECAAPISSDVESSGQQCAAPIKPSGIPTKVTSVSAASPLHGYLVDQLVIAASHLAATRIHEGSGIPFCQLCHMSGINGRPIPHLKSCEVGRVVAAIEDLRGAPPSQRWKGWDVEHVGRGQTLPLATDLA